MSGPAKTPSRKRLPPWLRKTLPPGGSSAVLQRAIETLGLATVCHSAKCPNRSECFAAGTATFMILGDVCTRSCSFCAVDKGPPAPPNAAEPQAIGEAIRRLKLRHVVITSVTRDDLPDGGAAHFAATIAAIRAVDPEATVEVLTPDFQGDLDCVDVVCDAGCDVFNHNIETAHRLYPLVRPEADYQRSLDILAHAAGQTGQRLWVKSGLMVGLGETDDEVACVLADLRRAGCHLVTIGQYLRPTDSALPVERFVPPEQFDAWRASALAMGFSAVAAGPFVRSSYHAGRMLVESGGKS